MAMTKYLVRSKLKEGFYWLMVSGAVHHGGKVQAMQELEVAGNIAPTVRNQRAVIADAQLTSSSLEPEELPIFRVGFST